MAYRTGESSEVGDLVCDRYDRYGTVTHVMMVLGPQLTELVIECEDGIVGIRYTSAEDFELVSRRGGVGTIVSVG